MKLLLNPSIKLRSDGGRAILFSVNPADDDHDVFRFLYPQQAIMLALFDGTRDLQEIKQQVAYLFSMDLRAATDQLESLLTLPVTSDDSMCVANLLQKNSRNQPIRHYNLADFVVPANSVNMEDLRCEMPFRALVLPTFRCVTDCIYCYADRRGAQRRANFDLKLFEKILKEIASCGIETVEFSGGDLFCRRDAFELIAEVFRHELYPVIPTKYPLSASNVQKLADLGLKTIQVSIDAVSPDLIDRMVRRHGYGKRILNTIDALGGAGIRVRTNTVMTPLNMAEVPDLISYLIKRPFIMRSNITCYARSIYQHHDSLFVKPAALKVVEERIMNIISANRERRITYGGPNADYYAGGPDEKTTAFKKRAFCTANRWGFVVLPDGRVTICEELYSHPDFLIGDLNHNSLTEIWHSAKALSLARPAQELVPDGACSVCADYRECHNGLGHCYRESIKAYGYDRAHWPDPRCPHAPRGNPFIAL